jgi:FKBP-type peptidyl-prolyl cis-trans isomerase
MRSLTKNEWVAVSIGVILVFTLIIVPSFNLSPVSALLGSPPSEEIVSEGIEGFVVKDLSIGGGAKVKNGDMVSVHYTGYLVDGTVFDTSKDEGVPFSYKVGDGQVIEGWDLGILGMRAGGARFLVIPPEMGYGGLVRGPIPANSTLLFEIELLEIFNENI